MRDGKLQPRYAPQRIIDTLHYIEPTAPGANFDDNQAARRHFRGHVKNFLDPEPNPFLNFTCEEYTNTNHYHYASAHHIDTSVGKTSIAIEEIALSEKSVVYAVPTLELADRVAEQFLAHGVIAPVWRGRKADDPENPGEEMCLNPDAVELALKVQADVTTSCCKYKKFKCDFFERCGYQKQIALLKQDKPRVVIAAADTLFHENEAIGTPDCVVLDESFWQKQLRGVDDAERLFMTFDNMRKRGHGKLADGLSKQQEIGGLQRRNSFGCGDLTSLIIEQYKLKPDIGLRPGMSPKKVAQLGTSDKIADAVYSKRIIAILKELRRMHEDWDAEIEISGRLLIDEKDGTRGIRWRGVAPIAKQFLQSNQSTLILDATLPTIEVLRISHPDVFIDSNIRVNMPPSVNIRQVLNSPTSSRKLIDSKPDRHRQSILRYILRRWMETGRGRTLVICQLPVEIWLREQQLPDEIELAHFNAIAGLDQYRDVRSLIVVGRTQPGPDGIEAMAATLSGAMPKIIMTAVNGFTWYDSVQRGIRLRNGFGIPVKGDQHPDEFCEAVRKLITEAEQVQAVGRARGIWRTEKTPLDIDLIFNTVVPITVDQVQEWGGESLLIKTAAEGVMLTSTVDLMKVWPGLWPNHSAADRTLKDGVPKLPGFELVTYQLDGNGQKPRTAYFDRSLIDDPGAWLMERLGPLTVV